MGFSIAGRVKPWKDLVTAVFKATNTPANFEYVDMP
jgi:hypothetical protein